MQTEYKTVEDYQRNTVLTITGSDSTSGSGVQADIKTISALGGYAVSVITSITVQNTIGIQDFYNIPPEVISGQIEAIVNDVQPQVVKIGMIRSAAAVRSITESLRKYPPLYVIYDPVIISSCGEVLMSDETIDCIKEYLLPLCSLVTIKKSSAEYIIGRSLSSASDMFDAACEILKFGCQAVLLQHGTSMAESSMDILVQRGESSYKYVSTPSMCNSYERHGVSSNLSSAIATFYCKGNDLYDAVTKAYNYVNQAFLLHTDLVGRASELYNEFVNEVAEHFTSNRDVRFYADSLNVSSRYLAQVTKRITGKAPKTIIDDYLCHEAELLLSSSDRTVQEIAYDFGFSSQAHFSKFFRKMTGVAPSEYRKIKQNTKL